jgi:LuxR family maltose regulon positive regulatory protein
MNADLTTLQQSAAHLLRLTQERNLLNEQGWAHLYLGCVAYQQNNLESAFQAFSTIVNRPYNTHGHAFWQAAFGLAAVLCAQGACERAQTLNDSLRATAWEMGGANVQEEADALTAFVALQRGQLVTTQRWAATYDRGQPIAPISMFYAPSLVLARILVDHATAQEHTRAQEWLQHLYEFSLATYNVRVQIEILALQAILHEVRGERAAALARLDNALQLAAPGGLVRVFIDLGAPLAPLLAELEGRESAPTLVRKILQSWPSLSEPIKPPHPALGRLLTPAADGGKNDHNSFNSEPLTRREQEVLALLAQRLTAEEVAQRLVISENTVKRHRTNIYQKLGVNRLRDALAIAGATGMLES